MAQYLVLMYSNEESWAGADEAFSNKFMEGHNKFGAKRARRTGITPTGVRSLDLYDLLLDAWPSPVVALNRAVAVSFAEGPLAGLGQSTHWAPIPNSAPTRSWLPLAVTVWSDSRGSMKRASHSKKPPC